jgi:chitodextrinase
LNCAEFNSLVVRHVITVTGLSTNTRYHYQVESEDEAGNPAGPRT